MGGLTQDPVENQFSVYRQGDGYNRNPTVRSSRYSFELNILTNSMRPPVSANSGSQTIEDDYIMNISSGDIVNSLNVREK